MIGKIFHIFSIVIIVIGFIFSFTSCDETINLCVNGHDWGEYSQTVLPTCTEAGIRTRACTRDGCSIADTVTQEGEPALGHLAPGATVATCTSTGTTGEGICTRANCNIYINGEEIPIDPANHTGGEKNGITSPATCTATGIQQILCNGCNAQLRIDTLNLNPINHAGGEKNGTTVSATCTMTGTQQILCNGCDALLRIETLSINPAAHAFTQWQITTAATCISDGVETEKCSCGTLGTVTRPLLTRPAHTPNLNTGKCTVCNALTYSVGDVGPGGGRIFYRTESGFTVEGYTGTTGSFAEYTAHYLEAAPQDSGIAQYGGKDMTTSGVTLIDSNIDPLARKIGNGRRDTRIIIDFLNSLPVPESDRAAQICASANFGGKYDWFLPSLGELYLYAESSVTGRPSFEYYMSSSQYYQMVWIMYFSHGWDGNMGLHTASNKNDDYKVRAIRAF